MTILDSLVLGGVQGVTEFIPVSSSGHLILAEKFLSLDSNFTFGVLLNIGTLFALLVFFNRRINNAFTEVFVKKNYWFGLILVLSIVPTLIAGFLFSAFFEDLSENLWVIVVALLIVGLLMVRFGKSNATKIHEETKASVNDAVIIGLSQMLALVPGVSRSGITILTGVNKGFSVEAAANFSFLMAAPTIAGAIVHSLFFKDGLAFIGDNPAVFWAGNLVSLLLGLLAVKTMLGLLKRHGLAVFGWYRLGLGTLIGILLIINVL
ncbi:MAG: undecaprenyl-diphosphate phosphatase [Patescibacteria group bacterium]